MRAEFVRERIVAGETNPYRIVKSLEARQRKFRLIGTPAGKAHWEKQPWPKEWGETPAGVPAFRLTSSRGNMLRAPFHCSDNLHNFLIDYLDETGPYDAVIELGCGYGRNILEIFYGGGPRDIAYFGGELTDSGVAIARELAALEPRLDARFFHFDYLAPDLGAVPRFDRALVFTMHSIEQVKLIGPELFDAISRVARDVACIHFEPFGFQVATLGPATEAHRKTMEKNGWNLNFAAALQEAARRYPVKVDYMATELFMPIDPHNPTSIAVWHSTAAEGSVPSDGGA